MKLLMENWRKYVAESEKADIYGKMYLFEDDNIRKVSFYDHFNQLNENDDDVERFLENWEKSVDHQLNLLNEGWEDIQKQLSPQQQQIYQGMMDNPPATADMSPEQQKVLSLVGNLQAKDDPTLALSTQAWAILGRLKEKAVGPVLNVIKKLKNYQQQNPKSAKAIKVTVAGLIATAAAVGVFALVTGGGDAQAAQELAQTISAVDPGVGQDVAEVAQNFTPEAAAELISNQEQTVAQVVDTLAASGDTGLEQVAQAAEQVETSTFEDMMSDLQADKGAGEPGDAGDTEFVSLSTQGQEARSTYGPYGNDIYKLYRNDPEKMQNALQQAEKQWTQGNEIARVLEAGGDLEDLGISRKDFRQWAASSTHDASRADGWGWIPPKMMKALRKLVRQSATTGGL